MIFILLVQWSIAGVVISSTMTRLNSSKFTGRATCLLMPLLGTVLRLSSLLFMEQPPIHMCSLFWITYVVLLDLVLLVLDQLASRFCLIVTKINNIINIHVKVKIFCQTILKKKKEKIKPFLQCPFW